MRGQRIFSKDEVAFEVCPYFYAKCELDIGQECSIKRGTQGMENIVEWTKRVNKAQFCAFKGETLNKTQYENRRMGVKA